VPTALNDRQRTYLRLIFDVDQEIEAQMRTGYRPFERRPKASEWRWLEYSEPIPILNWPGSELWRRIKKAGLVDQGTGSTFAALSERGLVRVSLRGPDSYTHIQLTPAGRKLVRSWTGQQAYKAPPPGTLREWHWRAMAIAFAAGDAGLEGSYGDYGRVGWNTWLRLREYKWGALICEHVYEPPRDGRLRLTARGRALYVDQYQRYRALYPDVEAPEPNGRNSGNASSHEHPVHAQ
jgi:hypothetical protein